MMQKMTLFKSDETMVNRNLSDATTVLCEQKFGLISIVLLLQNVRKAFPKNLFSTYFDLFCTFIALS